MSSKDYLLEHGTPRAVPQSEPLDEDQIENAGGGFVWAVDSFTRLRRFLILGTEGGTYYASERDFTKENLANIGKLAETDGLRFVEEVAEISEAGRAPKNDPALWALATAMTVGNRETRRAAAEALPRVARIGTHLFHFVAYLDVLRGWGKTTRWAIQNWYASKDPGALAYDVVKYQQRDGVSHRDVLRMAHPRPASDGHRAVFGFVSGNVDHEQSIDELGRVVRNVRPWGQAASTDFEIRRVTPDTAALEITPEIIDGFLKARVSKTPADTAKLIREYRLPRETVPSEHLTSPEVWRALLDVGMPTGALVRNLANMTRLNVLDGDYRKLVLADLANKERIRKSRIHPLAILVAMATYGSGRGMRGGNEWVPIPAVMDALDGAFYLAFGNVEPTGKRILQAIDISGSMDSGGVAGSPLTPRAAASALALLTVHVEDDVDTVTFSCNGTPGGMKTGGGRWMASHGLSDGVEPYALSRRQRLDDVVRETSRMTMGGTDCALPMLWAADNARTYDAFVVYTDNETWAGRIHPAQALRDYRRQSRIGAKLAVVAMTATGYSIADPGDAGMLDVVGFDTATPGLLSEFIAGRL